MQRDWQKLRLYTTEQIMILKFCLLDRSTAADAIQPHFGKSEKFACYNAPVDQTTESDMRTFKTGDRVRWSAEDQAGDEGTVSRTFDRDGIDYFDVTWDDGEVIDYMDWPGTSCRKIGVAA